MNNIISSYFTGGGVVTVVENPTGSMIRFMDLISTRSLIEQPKDAPG